MLISEAKTFTGQFVKLVYKDRRGAEVERQTEVFDVGFVPLYGPCLITDVGEIRLDRVVDCESVAFARAA
jgi:hypothetical protein